MPDARIKDGLSRRSVLGLTGVAASGTLLSHWAAAAGAAPRPRSVILIFNTGAPSHIDLWDPKPESTDTTRGPFSPIRTNVAGVQVSELLPGLARHMDKLAVVRTVQHTHTSHNAGMYWSIVGRPYHKDSTHINPSSGDHPSLGTLVGWLAERDGYRGGVPPYVVAPFPQCDSGAWITPGQFGGCLGKRYDPFVFDSDVATADAKVQNLKLTGGISADRFGRRFDLLDQFNQSGRGVVAAAAAEIDVFNQRAGEILQSNQVADAFDLTKEPDAIRDRYGRHSWGQSHLLARRLVESGARFVTAVNGRSIIWDTHTDNFNRLQNSLVPPMDCAFAALLDDLQDRGLLDTTLVVWLGDFGRTPKINGNAGRDHWPNCYSVVLAGAGIRGGQTYGRSDKMGAYPETTPVKPADIHATVFSCLGYANQRIEYHLPDGRPMPLTSGEPIRDLIA